MNPHIDPKDPLDVFADVKRCGVYDVAKSVATEHDLTVRDMLDPQSRDAVQARRDFCHALHARGCWSYIRIARLLGVAYTTARSACITDRDRVESS